MKDAKDDYINSVSLNAESDFPYLVLDVINDQSAFVALGQVCRQLLTNI